MRKYNLHHFLGQVVPPAMSHTFRHTRNCAHLVSSRLASSQRDRVGSSLADELCGRGGRPCDCLLLCDVVYEPHLFPLLLATMADLCGPDTLSAPTRFTSLSCSAFWPDWLCLVLVKDPARVPSAESGRVAVLRAARGRWFCRRTAGQPRPKWSK